MSTNSSDLYLVSKLNYLSEQLNRYLSILILLFGTVGNLLNCLALSQRALRSNPCAAVFLASSIPNMVTLISGVTVRLLAGWGLDLTNTVGWLCKFRVFVLFAARTTASWLIALATINRWLSSSSLIHRRQLSTLKNTHRGIILVSILSSLAYLQIFYCYESNLLYTPVKCYGKTAQCRLAYDLEFTCLSALLPSLIMFSFGLMTVSNIHHARIARIYPMPNPPGDPILNANEGFRRQKKLDRHLLRMLCIQVILLTLFSLPQATYSLYSNVVLNSIQSLLDDTIRSFILNFFFLLTYVTNGMPFYMYTLTGGPAFRRALLKSIQEFRIALTF